MFKTPVVSRTDHNIHPNDLLYYIRMKMKKTVYYFQRSLSLNVWLYFEPGGKILVRVLSQSEPRIIPPRITYYSTLPLILDHSYLVGKLTSSKIADTKVSGF
jgi:hypothetical protein